MNALNFVSSEKGIVVTGKTFDVKDILKAHGASWSPEAAAWVFRGKTDVEAVQAAVTAEIEAAAAAKKAARKVELAKAKAVREWLKTPEGKAHAVAEAKARVVAARAAGAHWICCDKCEVIDWARQHTACMACAHWDGQSYNSFRVRGMCYTGD
jgi:hypothetical protein